MKLLNLMSREKLGSRAVVAFRYGATLGIGVIIWLQTNTVFQKEYKSDRVSHDRERDLILEHLNTKFGNIEFSIQAIREDLRRINTKLDRLVIYNPPRTEPELRGKL